jgi:hypothetical protein
MVIEFVHALLIDSVRPHLPSPSGLVREHHRGCTIEMKWPGDICQAPPPPRPSSNSTQRIRLQRVAEGC